MKKYLLSSLRTKPRNSFWQLILFPCAACICYCQSLMPSFLFIGRLGLQIGSAAAAALVFTCLLALFQGGLRACALGLNGFLALMFLEALLEQYRAQKTAGFPGGWLYTFYYDRPMAVLAVAAAAILPMLLLRLLLPEKHSAEQLRRNFAQAFRLIAVGFSVIYVCLLFYGFFLVRMGDARHLPPNLVPFQMIQEYFTRMREAPWEAYEMWTYLFGNLLVLFPMGFLLKGLLRRKTWIALAIPSAFSLLMELAQQIFRLGHCDIDDWILNTLGAAMGVGAVLAMDALRKVITKGEERTIWDTYSLHN